MTRRFAFTWMAVLALFVSNVAYAQQVLVLDFKGDKRDRVRTQIVRELAKVKSVKVVGMKTYRQRAAAAGFRGADAESAAAIAAVSPELRISVVVDGQVSRAFKVRFLDSNGAELWTRSIPLSRGALSKRNVQRLTKAIVAAAKAAPAPKKAAEPEPEPEPEETAEVAPEETAPSRTGSTPAAEGGQLPTGTAPPEESAEARARRLAQEERESHTVTGTEAAAMRDEDLEREAARRSAASRVGPKLITVSVGGTTTWRAYCSRPGVQSCREYDERPQEERPAGDTVDFSPQVPYAGFGVGLEFFPLASLDNPLNGLGISGAFNRGFSLTNVRVQTPSGDQPERKVVSIDDAWHAFGHYRYYFGFGDKSEPLVGYVGVRGGIAARTFEVDPSAQVPLPGSHRRFPAVGLEASVPLAKLVRIEAAGLYFINPAAGAEELAGYGTEVKSSGFGAEAGIAGTIWGPVGYTLKFRLFSYRDEFTGAGGKWPEGGAAEETYSGLFWGATAAF